MLKLFGKAVTHFLFGQAMKDPEVSLSQTRINRNAHATARADDFGRLHGPAEIAAVEGGTLLAAKPLRQGARLQKPALGEGTIEMALVAAFHVPSRFTMPNNYQVRRSRIQKLLHQNAVKTGRDKRVYIHELKYVPAVGD